MSISTNYIDDIIKARVNTAKSGAEQTYNTLNSDLTYKENQIKPQYSRQLASTNANFKRNLLTNNEAMAMRGTASGDVQRKNMLSMTNNRSNINDLVLQRQKAYDDINQQRTLGQVNMQDSIALAQQDAEEYKMQLLLDDYYKEQELAMLRALLARGGGGGGGSRTTNIPISSGSSSAVYNSKTNTISGPYGSFKIR